jgi:hypothetical protein
LFPSAVAEERDHSFSPPSIELPLRMNQMHPNLMADGSENTMGQFGRIVTRIELTGLLALPDNSEDKLKVSPPLYLID